MHRNIGNIETTDSTLREGEQRAHLNFTFEQRLELAKMLGRFGVQRIEISPEISNDHRRSTEAILNLGLNAKIVGHVRALESSLNIALDCNMEHVATYIGVSREHQERLRMNPDEVIGRAEEIVIYAKRNGLDIRFTMEDASRADRQFLLEICRRVEAAGADSISIPDTVGCMIPSQFGELVESVRKVTTIPLEVHCHNDLGFALANAFAGLEAGATRIHTTINGWGERTGIPSLAEVSTILERAYKVPNNYRLEMLTEMSAFLESITGFGNENAPLTSRYAFADKAGTHTTADGNWESAYRGIVNAQDVGNRDIAIVGPLSGKRVVTRWLILQGIEPTEQRIDEELNRIKNSKRDIEVDISKIHSLGQQVRN